MVSAPPFSHSVPASDIPPAGREFRIEADAAERRALAEDLGIPDVTALTAELAVRPAAGRAFSVRGALKASVVQTDVVTLEAVVREVNEAIDVTLMRAEGEASGGRRREVLVDMDEADGPELYHDGRIDLGVIVSEHLALGLDPYPRAPGSGFEAHIEADSPQSASPFAALEKLRNRDD